VQAYRTGSLGIRVDPEGQRSIAVQATRCLPWRTRALGALRQKAPRVYGGCRTRGSGATLAATLQAQHGIAVSADTVQRWRQESGWGWQRAQLVAQDAAPHRSERCARLRLQHAHLPAHAVMVVAEKRAMHLLPQVGAAWRRHGTQAELLTPGQNEQPSLAGARPREPDTGL
jgi:hypothetical protein